MQFDSYPVYDDNEKYFKTKIRIYGDRVITNFQGKKHQNTKSEYII